MIERFLHVVDHLRLFRDGLLCIFFQPGGRLDSKKPREQIVCARDMNVDFAHRTNAFHRTPSVRAIGHRLCEVHQFRFSILHLVQDAPKGFRGDFLNQMKDAESKLMDLAQAMPDSSYGWRPMEGVRSVSEVYIHIAGANYLFPRFFGVKPPAGLEKDAEKTITEKSKVIDYMKKSFDHIRQAVLATSDDSLNNPTKMFGEETTYRGAIFRAAIHT